MMTFFGLTGVVSAQTITNTGPGSTNTISSTYTNNCSVRNSNNVSVSNSNNQSASTGNANESGNTSAGLSWAGWTGMDPAAAQAAGTGYAGWWGGVVNWIGQRASGAGWNSDQSNLSWTPSSTEWASYDPMTWQSSGQSFGNWYNAVESYLNGNSSAWVLGWPADANGAGNFGATSGNAVNNNNANFSININNAARAAAGTDNCGRSNFTPPATGGGMGSGPAMGAPAVVAASNNYAPKGGSGYGGGYGGGYYAPSSYSAPAAHVSAPAQVASAPIVNNAPSAPAGGGMGSGPSAPAPSSNISNTGPGSTNTISSTYTNNSSVSNCNNVSVSNMNSQSASSGDSNVSGNTSVGGAGSGNAGNNNGTGGAVGVSN